MSSINHILIWSVPTDLPICHSSLPLHLFYILPIASLFISHSHLSIQRSIYEPCPSTWYLPVVANPSEASSRLAPWRNTNKLHVATFNCYLLHLHCWHFRGHQNWQCCHLVVCGICVELTEVATLIQNTDVCQCDAHKPWCEEYHLETVVLQGWRWWRKEWDKRKMAWQDGREKGPDSAGGNISLS